MKLKDADIVRLLPQFMREDRAVSALATACNRLIRSAAMAIPPLRVWDQLEDLDDAQLDELAWELNVLWYDVVAPIDTKRRLIRNSDKVYSKLGTKWAVEEVIAAYLGDAQTVEWWEYNGQPHHFKVVSNNPLIGAELEGVFTRALDIVKRKSQWLDAIVTTLEAAGTCYAGFAAQEVTVETITITDEVGDMSPGELREYAGSGYIESRSDTITMTEPITA